MPGKRRSGRQGKRRRTPIASFEMDRTVEQLWTALDAGPSSRDVAARLVQRILSRPRQAADAIERQLTAGRAPNARVALQILQTCAGRDLASRLDRIAESRETPDTSRLLARGVLTTLGAVDDQDAGARRAFLDTLRDPIAALQSLAESAAGTWPPDAEILQEVAACLAAMPAETALSLLADIAALDEGGVPWFLHAVFHITEPALQRTAIQAVLARRDVGAAGALRRLIATTGNSEIRMEAEAALRRLQVRPAGVAPVPAGRPLPALRGAFLSQADISGGQYAVVARQVDEGLLAVTNLSWGKGGIGAAFGTSMTPEDSLDEVRRGLIDMGVATIEVPLPGVRGALESAAVASAAAGRAIPPAFELWEPLLHDAYPPAEDEPAEAPELDDGPYAGRRDLVAESESLIRHPLFFTWRLGEDQSLKDILGGLRGGNSRLTRLYNTAVRNLVDRPTLDALRRGLRRQAWLLRAHGDRHDMETALAVAGSLAAPGLADKPQALARHPFVRGLLQATIADALERTRDDG